MALRNLTTWTYTTDPNRGSITFRRKVDAALVAQTGGAGTEVLVGGADYDGSPYAAPMPTNLIPRHARVSAPGGSKRRVIINTPDCPIATGEVTTIDLQVLGGAAVEYTVDEVVSERWKRSGSAND